MSTIEIRKSKRQLNLLSGYQSPASSRVQCNHKTKVSCGGFKEKIKVILLHDRKLLLKDYREDYEHELVVKIVSEF